MKQGNFYNGIVWFIIFLLVFTSIPIDSKAETGESVLTNNETNSEKSTDPKVDDNAQPKIEEIVEERTDNTKVFDNGDGTFTKNIYFEPVHRKDGEEWEEISPELHTTTVGNEPVIETEHTLLQSVFNQEMKNGEYATFKRGTDAITFSILEASGNGEKSSVKDVKPTFEDNKILHRNIFPDADLRNFTFDQNVKEDIILNSYKGFNSFKFRLSTGLEAKEQADGSITFHKSGETKTVFSLPKPFMTDSNIDPLSAEAVRSENVSYSFERENENGYILTVTADEEWLKDPAREYPVYIDPTTSLATSADAFVMSAYPTTNYGTPTQKWDSSQNQYVLKVGYYDGNTGTNYAFLKQDIAKIKNAVIDDAKLKVFVTHSYYATTPNGLWLDEVSGSWTETGLTWNNKPSSVNIGKIDVMREQWGEFNVLNTVKAWAAGTKTNNGFKLHTNGNTQAYWKKVVSSDNSTNKPFLAVTYHYNAPPAPTATAHSNGTGSGTGYLNINWTKVPGATGYKVLIFNGKAYEAINVGDVSTWSTKGQKLWPTKAQYESGAYGLRIAKKDGTEFAFNPNPVYQVAALDGGTYASRKNYAIRIVAIYPGGDSPQSGAAVPYMPMETPKLPTGKAYANAVNGNSGYVNLQWTPTTEADGYKILMFNGKTYQVVDDVSANQTTWTTQNKAVWPTEAQIQQGLFELNTEEKGTKGKGTELAIDPAPVYKNAASGYEGRTNYWFRVKAYSNDGHPESAVSEAYMPTIPATTIPTTPKSPIGEAYNNFNDPKKGYVELKWDKVVNATGYKIWIFNGKSYEAIDVGDVNSWSTKDQDIWPSDKEIQEGKFQLHTTPKNSVGTDLPIDPRQTYINSGGTYTTSTNFWFRISAYNDVGESPYSSTAFTPNLPKQNDYLGVENHLMAVSVPKGSVNIFGNLVIQESDLSIEGRGPSVHVSRTFNSQSEVSGAFGKGWTSNLDFSVKENPQGNVIITDEDGSNHQYIKDYKNGGYQRPPGRYEILTKDSTSGFFYLKDKEQTSYMFGTNGRIKEITDSHNNKVVFSYNISNQLTSIQDASGRTTIVSYDPAGRINTIKDPEGRTFTYTYIGDLLTEYQDSEKARTKYIYDNNVLKSIQEPTHTAEKPVETHIIYEGDKVKSVKDVLGSTTTVNYTPNLHKLSVVNPNLSVTEHYFNTKGNDVHTIEDVTGLKLLTKYTYENNLLEEVKDPKDKITKYSYDAEGNTLTIQEPNEQITSYTYDEFNNVLTEKDGLGNVTSNTYNIKNELVETLDPEGNKTSFGYDQYGNLTSITDSKGQTTFFTYDSKGNYVISEKIPDRLESEQQPTIINNDVLGAPTNVRDGNGNTTYFSYNSNKELIRVSDAKGKETLYTYDSMGNIQKVLDARKNIIEYKYNEFNLITDHKNPLNQTIKYQYDKFGNLNNIAYPNGNSVKYGYDMLNRQTFKEVDTLKWNYEYDNNGNLTTVILNSTHDSKYIYDDSNRLVSEVKGLNSTSLNYDLNDNLISLNSRIGTLNSLTEYMYNTKNKLSLLSDIYFNESLQASYFYDERSNEKKITRSNGTSTDFSYNEPNQLSTITNIHQDGSIINTYNYKYDQNGNIISFNTNKGTITYVYDSLNQLVKEVLLDGTEIIYEYDEVGNRTKKTESKNGSINTFSFQYDAANQLISVNGKNNQYDSNGNLTKDDNHIYVYDGENQLIEVKNLLGTSIAKYTYDHEGRRFSKKTSEGTTNYFYNGNKVIYETDEMGNLLVEYTWDAIGNPVTMIKEGQIYYYHFNGHKDITALTDTSGNIVAEYEYDAWGNIVSLSGEIAESNPYRYSGYRHDEETKNYYLMSRYYNPEIGRFLTRDSYLGEVSEPLSLNLYSYTHNNPVMFSDHNGYAQQNDGFGHGVIQRGGGGASYASPKVGGNGGAKKTKSKKSSWKKMSTKEATEAARKLGYTPTSSYTKNNQKIFYKKKNKTYISQDIGSGDGSPPHNGGVWKMAKSPDALNSKKSRLGTYDKNLKRIGD
ncbi:DNRLRE domain-containing protein [Fictibacillus sp. JL2B1089]|uniref:DNRLRE domain-containing protein n=1 Tax=Fictibacillus sp. JL2B1089 TaxID=3399565 RepID=UPI003A8AE4B1